jgi:hypothetical protein
MKINLKKLPKHIYNQFPYSIRSYKDEYDLQELPFDLRDLIEEFLNKDKTFSTRDTIYDAFSNVSPYGDLLPIKTKTELFIEYLTNYVKIGPRAYPFDATFYCDIKRHLQTKDTALRQKLISKEVSNIIRTVSSDLDISVDVIEIVVHQTDFKIRVKIDGKEKGISVSVM